jgi:hypothetical protein
MAVITRNLVCHTRLLVKGLSLVERTINSRKQSPVFVDVLVISRPSAHCWLFITTC